MVTADIVCLESFYITANNITLRGHIPQHIQVAALTRRHLRCSGRTGWLFRDRVCVCVCVCCVLNATLVVAVHSAPLPALLQSQTRRRISPAASRSSVAKSFNGTRPVTEGFARSCALLGMMATTAGAAATARSSFVTALAVLAMSFLCADGSACAFIEAQTGQICRGLCGLCQVYFMRCTFVPAALGSWRTSFLRLQICKKRRVVVAVVVVFVVVIRVALFSCFALGVVAWFLRRQVDGLWLERGTQWVHLLRRRRRALLLRRRRRALLLRRRRGAWLLRRRRRRRRALLLCRRRGAWLLLLLRRRSALLLLLLLLLLFLLLILLRLLLLLGKLLRAHRLLQKFLLMRLALAPLFPHVVRHPRQQQHNDRREYPEPRLLEPRHPGCLRSCNAPSRQSSCGNSTSV